STFDRLEGVTAGVTISAGDQLQRHHKGARVYYPLVPLSVSDAVFPAAAGEADKDRALLTEAYGQLWKGFIAEQEQLPRGSFQAYFDSLVYLLHKYTWCIPSATSVNDPSISLFDHSRVAAALAVCLFDVRQSGHCPEQEFLLIEGDISGIQAFIYNPAFNGQELQNGMARRLRGRSFYINLLNRTVADYLLGQLGLYSINMLWSAGGHFLIIAPNTTETEAGMKAARTNVERWLWR